LIVPARVLRISAISVFEIPLIDKSATSRSAAVNCHAVKCA